MPSIVGKKQGNKTYYYLVESARVGGKPRIVSQRYLGPAEEIIARLSETGPGEPDRTRHLAFGDVAAVWAVLERLKIADIVDDVVGSRRSDAAASVGTYIALATLNRVCDPCSKLAFAEWWAKTACDRWLRLPGAALDHRRFWEAMDHLSETELTEIERRVVAAMVEAFGIDGLDLEIAPAQRVALLAVPALGILAPRSRSENLARCVRSPSQLRVKQEHGLDDQFWRWTSRFIRRAHRARAREQPPVDDPGVKVVDDDSVTRETFPISPVKGREEHRAEVACPGRRLMIRIAHPRTGAGRLPLMRRHRAHSLFMHRASGSDQAYQG